MLLEGVSYACVTFFRADKLVMRHSRRAVALVGRLFFIEIYTDRIKLSMIDASAFVEITISHAATLVYAAHSGELSASRETQESLDGEGSTYAYGRQLGEAIYASTKGYVLDILNRQAQKYVGSLEFGRTGGEQGETQGCSEGRIDNNLSLEIE